jgi:predicted hydrocarbon binding protein
MAIEQLTEWVIDHKFDRKTCRHSTNGFDSVLHCHHYASLYCQLADDAQQFNGPELLRRSAELSFQEVLSSYFTEHQVKDLSDRIVLAEEYWKVCGFGTMKFDHVGELSAAAHMDHSHVDEGWMKKWGNRDKPVNFIGQGYIAAALSAIYDLPVGSYSVYETESIVTGADASRFSLVRK